MKRLSLALVTFFSLAIGMSLTSVSPLSAQVKEDLMVVVIPYPPLQNLDLFFLNSVHPLQFIEAGYGEKTSVFVSMITPEQKTTFEKAGYKPVIIDQKAGSIDQYYIMTTLRHRLPNIAAQLQDPALKQQGLELAYQLATYTTLLKIAPETSFSQLSIPALAEHNARQLHRDLVPPTGRTSIKVQPSSVPTTIAPATATPKTDQRWIAFLVFGAIVCFLVISLKKKPQK